MNQALHATRPGGHAGFVGVGRGVALDGMDMFWSLAQSTAAWRQCGSTCPS